MIRDWFNSISKYVGRTENPTQNLSDLYTKPEYAHSNRLEESLQDLYLDAGVFSESFREVVAKARKKEADRASGKACRREISTAA